MLFARHRAVTHERYTYLAYERQNGFYMHLPKYWSCWGENHDSYWQMMTRPRTITIPDTGETITMEPSFDPDGDYAREAKKRAAGQREAHSHCHFPYRHLSYQGYARWLGKHRTVTWWYWGDPPHGKRLTVSDHHEDRLRETTILKGHHLDWTRQTWRNKWKTLRPLRHYRWTRLKRGWDERHPKTEDER